MLDAELEGEAQAEGWQVGMVLVVDDVLVDVGDAEDVTTTALLEVDIAIEEEDAVDDEELADDEEEVDVELDIDEDEVGDAALEEVVLVEDDVVVDVLDIDVLDVDMLDVDVLEDTTLEEEELDELALEDSELVVLVEIGVDTLLEELDPVDVNLTVPVEDAVELTEVFDMTGEVTGPASLRPALTEAL